MALPTFRKQDCDAQESLPTNLEASPAQSLPANAKPIPFAYNTNPINRTTLEHVGDERRPLRALLTVGPCPDTVGVQGDAHPEDGEGHANLELAIDGGWSKHQLDEPARNK